MYFWTLVPNMWRKYPIQGGQAPAQERREVPHPQHQSSPGNEQHVKPPSMHFSGRQSKPAIDAIVHGVGSNATSFPPTDTISISSGPILSHIKWSWDRSLKVRSLSVVASTFFGRKEDHVCIVRKCNGFIHSKKGLAPIKMFIAFLIVNCCNCRVWFYLYTYLQY